MSCNTEGVGCGNGTHCVCYGDGTPLKPRCTDGTNGTPCCGNDDCGWNDTALIGYCNLTGKVRENHDANTCITWRPHCGSEECHDGTRCVCYGQEGQPPTCSDGKDHSQCCSTSDCAWDDPSKTGYCNLKNSDVEGHAPHTCVVWTKWPDGHSCMQNSDCMCGNTPDGSCVRSLGEIYMNKPGKCCVYD